MKKAKIILTVVTVLAVVGGALAFKAQKGYLGDLRCGIEAHAICIDATYTTVAASVGSGAWSYCTALDAPTDTRCCFYTRVVFDQ